MIAHVLVKNRFIYMMMISLEVHIGLTNWPDHMFMMKLNNPLVDLNSCFSLLMELGISSMKTALDCSKTWYQEIWNFLDMLQIKKLTGTGTDNKILAEA
jgi:hypothetical protein